MDLRPFREDDADPIVELSLRAWAPVFESVGEQVGPDLFHHFYGDDWRAHQAADVRRACAAHEVLVAEADGEVAGFVTIDLPDEGDEGEIYMLAVDVSFQGRGIGSALTEAAVDRIRRAGKRVAVVDTGGDPGHARARATYRRAGFVGLPAERFYRLL